MMFNVPGNDDETADCHGSHTETERESSRVVKTQKRSSLPNGNSFLLKFHSGDQCQSLHEVCIFPGLQTITEKEINKLNQHNLKRIQQKTMTINNK